MFVSIDMATVIHEVRRVLDLEAKAIAACAERLARDPESAKAFTRSIQTLRQSLEKGGKIVVTGIGKSGNVGRKIAATLSSTGSLAVFLHPTEGLHGDLGILSPNDVVLALSYTGNTEELAQLLPSIQRRGVPIVSICGNPSSRLAEGSTVWIDASVAQEACPHNLAPTSSTTLALAIGDAIAIALMGARGFDAESFARNHPGGSLGRRLSLRVVDIMHAGDSVATAAVDATMDEVVVRSTDKKLGIVLIVDNMKKLVGVITDGDIRRALSQRERFFTLRASDVMTRKPVTIAENAMAADGLALMQNRPSQINALPVVDDHGRWLGVVRLHDLVKVL